MIDLADYREVDPAWCRQQGFPPNRFYTDGEAMLLVVKASTSSGDYALNQKALDHLAAKRPDTGLVVLADSSMVPVAVVPVKEMAERLRDHPPRDGRFGPYWWVNATGHLAGGGGFADPF